MKPATVAIHAGTPKGANAPASPPITLASTYAWESFEQEPQYVYSRYTNPNREALEDLVAKLEGAEFGVGFGSGIAAIHAGLELAKAGDHVLIADDIYGGTYNLGQSILPRHDVQVGGFDATEPGSLRRAAKPNTKVLIFESPTNPTLRMTDIAAIASEAKALGIITVFDNTFATPYLQNPISMGIDIVVHSSTKYLGGHSDVLGGVAVANDPAIHKHLLDYAMFAGSVPGPFDCWLVCRGIRTLIPRMKMQCDTAQRLAEFLESHPKVKAVNYPGLASHPGHELAKRQMRLFGAMLSFDLDGPVEEAKTLGLRSKLFRQAASLGGVESMLSYPPKLSHKGMTEEQRLERGIPPTLLRVSVGLEDPDDLIGDLKQAIEAG